MCHLGCQDARKSPTLAQSEHYRAQTSLILCRFSFFLFMFPLYHVVFSSSFGSVILASVYMASWYCFPHPSLSSLAFASIQSHFLLFYVLPCAGSKLPPEVIHKLLKHHHANLSHPSHELPFLILCGPPLWMDPLILISLPIDDCKCLKNEAKQCNTTNPICPPKAALFKNIG